MPQCTICTVCSYRPDPTAIYAMVLDRSNGKLALARSDATIEIWNLNHLPFIEKTITSNLKNFSVQGLVWCDKRLFSTGLHGWLVEYDLYRLCMKDKWTITGEAGTCLDTCNTQIAVGTEQGYINIFEVTSNGAQFEKFLDKQEGRIVCLKFNATGEFVVAGSVNAIRIWNVKTGHALHKMQLSKSEAKKNTVVWCLEVLADFTIFSGDSRGVLTLWDGKIGSQIEIYQSHKADITALCLDEHEESLYCSGVDPLISNYEKVKVGSSDKWVKSVQRKIHDHDVRALVFHNQRLYSAGVDSYLVCSYHPPKTLIKYAPILQSPCIQTTVHPCRLILFRYSRHIEIWSFAWTLNTHSFYTDDEKPHEKPKKLVLLQKLGKNWENEDEPEGIVFSCISSNGKWIFLATSSEFSLYAFQFAKSQLKLEKIKDLDDSNIPCVRAAFNNKYNQLIVALSSGQLVVYDLEDGEPFINQRIEYNKEHLADTVSLLEVSSCGRCFAVADALSNIVIFQNTSDGYSFKFKLPKTNVPPTAMCINSNTHCIVVAYANNSVYEFSLKMQKSTGLFTQLENMVWKPKTHTIRNIVFDAANNEDIFLHDDDNILIIKRQQHSAKTEPKAESGRKQLRKSVVNEESNDLEIITLPKCWHLVHLSSIAEREFVAVEVNPLDILEKLPPAFEQTTFGCK